MFKLFPVLLETMLQVIKSYLSHIYPSWKKEIQGNIHVSTRLCKSNRKDKPEANEIVYSIPKAVITRDRVAYNHRNFLSPGSRGQKCKTKGSAGLAPSEGCEGDSVPRLS